MRVMMAAVAGTIGRAVRITAAVMVVLVVLGATLETTGATTIHYTNIRFSRTTFIKACKSSGGTAENNGSSTKCGYADGGYSNCNFQTKKCSDHFPDLVPSPEYQIFLNLVHGTGSGGVVTDGQEQGHNHAHANGKRHR